MKRSWVHISNVEFVAQISANNGTLKHEELLKSYLAGARLPCMSVESCITVTLRSNSIITVTKEYLLGYDFKLEQRPVHGLSNCTIIDY